MSTSDTASTGRGEKRTHGCNFLERCAGVLLLSSKPLGGGTRALPAHNCSLAGALFLEPLQRKDVSGAFAGTAEPPPPPAWTCPVCCPCWCLRLEMDLQDGDGRSARKQHIGVWYNCPASELSFTLGS